MRYLIKKLLHTMSRVLPPYSRLILAADSENWVIAHEMKELADTVVRLGGRTLDKKYLPFVSNQCVFFGSHFDLLLNPDLFRIDNRYATAYFHGRPGSGNTEIDKCYENLVRYRDQIHRIQVSHSAMRDVVLESGIDGEKVFQIPIAVNTDIFSPKIEASIAAARSELQIPESAVVLGSFQKDGNGWGEGTEPKLIKGPDILLKAVELLKVSVPDLYVLLSGPARGYVKNGLERLNVPYRHVYQQSYTDIGAMYHALDIYMVASREEGGPKAVLESMASGVPLVTTRVGQAMDLVKHQENGWVVDVGDYEGLAYWAEKAISAGPDLGPMMSAARETAERNSYKSQYGIWNKFMNGYLTM